MSDQPKIPERLIQLINWDLVHEDDGGNLDDESDEGKRCPIFEAWEVALIRCEDKNDVLYSEICNKSLMRSVPPEQWYDGFAPESFAEINNMIANLSDEQRDKIVNAAQEIVTEVLVIAREQAESRK